MRLDRAVVARNLARSRTHAHSLIEAGAVLVDGEPATKPSVSVTESADITLTESADPYVSRGARKLVGALDACEGLGLMIAGKDALDAGASTGGFTQVLLERGARHVIALDVGHDQIAPSVRADHRVDVVEGANVRDLSAQTAGAGVEIVVADLSFISLTLAIPALRAFAAQTADFVLMVKPQFEVGREKLGHGGVVTSLRDRRDAVTGVVNAMRAEGLGIHHVARSVLPGPRGNVEFFVWGSGAWQAKTVTGRDTPVPVLESAQIAAAIAQEVGGSS